MVKTPSAFGNRDLSTKAIHAAIPCDPTIRQEWILQKIVHPTVARMEPDATMLVK